MHLDISNIYILLYTFFFILFYLIPSSNLIGIKIILHISFALLIIIL